MKIKNRQDYEDLKDLAKLSDFKDFKQKNINVINEDGSLIFDVSNADIVYKADPLALKLLNLFSDISLIDFEMYGIPLEYQVIGEKYVYSH